jgi:hypothetical protein
MRRDLRSLGALLALAGTALLPGAALGLELSISEEYPLRGERLAITLSGEGAGDARALRVTYRPNSQTSHQETLPLVGGRLEWTPRDAGIVRLEVLGADQSQLHSRNVAVRFGAFPASGIAVMVIAATLLFGGAALSMFLLLRAPGVAEDAIEPPST